MCHQPVERRAGTALQLRHELGFVLRPGKDAGQVRHACRLSRLCAPSVFADYSAANALCLAQQALKPLTGSPDQKPVQPKAPAGKRFNLD